MTTTEQRTHPMLPVWAQREPRTRVTLPCVFCGSFTAVIETRASADPRGPFTRRRRQCISPDCGRRFTTHERPFAVPKCFHCDRSVNRRTTDEGKLVWCSRKTCLVAKRQYLDTLLRKAARELEA